MLIPIGDKPNPPGFALVNWSLIAANVLVFLVISQPLMLQPLGSVYHNHTEYDRFVFEYGFRAAHPSVLALFVSMFLHAGWMHLIGNMLFLWIFGDNVEARLGRGKYLLAYLATGVCATAGHALLSGRGDIPVIGASGAVSGVMGFYYMWFPHNTVRVLVWFGVFGRVLEIPAGYVLLFYLGVDNLLPFLLSSGSTGVAHGAHIGGFLAGCLIAHLVDRHDREELLAPQRAALDPGDALRLVDRLLAEGRAEEALVVLRQQLARGIPGPAAADLHLRAGEILLDHFADHAAAYQHLTDAIKAGLDPAGKERGRALLEHIHAQQRLARFRA